MTRRVPAAACCFLLCAGLAEAGAVTMADGTVHVGTLQPVRGITENQLLPPEGSDPEKPNKSTPLLLIDTLTRRTWVPRKRVASVDDRTTLATGRVEFVLDARDPAPPRAITSIGQTLKATPWSGHGRRTLTLKTSTGQVEVVQAVRRVSRDGLELFSPTHQWSSALDVAAVPVNELEAMLAANVDLANPDERLAVARFYVEAGMYPRAAAVLDGVKRDFPELGGRVDEAVAGAKAAYGAAALAEIVALRSAGADATARSVADLFPVAEVPPEIAREVESVRRDYAEADDRAATARVLFDMLHGELQGADAARFAPYRPELADAILPGTVDRLDPFLAFADDATLPAADRLALAYSGWALGAGGASTDPDRAAGLWRARRLLGEVLAATDATRAGRLRDELAGVESVDVPTVRGLAERLRPWVETDHPLPAGLSPTEPFALRCAPGFGADAVPGGPPAYSVALPPGYSRDRLAPALIVLGPYGRDPAEGVKFWGVNTAGGGPQPRAATARGYVVVCPDLTGTLSRDIAGGADATRHPYGQAQLEAVRAVVEDVRRRFAVDPDRCYLAGHWSGGDAALDVALELPDLFAAAAVFCGRTHKFTNVLNPNAAACPLYVVGGQIDRNTAAAVAPQLREMMIAGDDVTYVEYFGRGWRRSRRRSRGSSTGSPATPARPTRRRSTPSCSARRAGGRRGWRPARCRPPSSPPAATPAAGGRAG